MPRLYRPAIPIEVKCRVALRQLGETSIDGVIEDNRARLGQLLAWLLPRLANHLNCKESDLRLDHDPALENRMRRTVTKVWRGKVRQITIYSPDANDPRDLIYREKHGHHIKTNVSGEHGQFPDNTIAKRERRRLKKIAKKRERKPRGPKPKRTWPSRPFPQRSKKR